MTECPGSDTCRGEVGSGCSTRSASSMGSCRAQRSGRSTTKDLGSSSSGSSRPGLGRGSGPAGWWRRRGLAALGPSGCVDPQAAGSALGLRGRMPTMLTVMRGCPVPGAQYSVLGAGCWVLGTGCWVLTGSRRVAAGGWQWECGPQSWALRQLPLLLGSV